MSKIGIFSEENQANILLNGFLDAFVDCQMFIFNFLHLVIVIAFSEQTN